MNYLQQRKRMVSGIGMWWLADGMSEGNCLAAYQLKGRYSQADALTDMTGHGYGLTNSGGSWSSGSGMYLAAGAYLDNGGLRGSSTKSIIIKVVSSWAAHVCPLTGGWGNINVWLATSFCTKSFAYVAGGVGIGHQNGLSVLYDSGGLPMSYVQLCNTSQTGTFGFTLSGEALYRNGTGVSKYIAHHDSYGSDTQWTGFIAANLPRLIGGRAHGSTTGKWNDEGNLGVTGNFTVSAFAVYNINLSWIMSKILKVD